MCDRAATYSLVVGMALLSGLLFARGVGWCQEGPSARQLLEEKCAVCHEKKEGGKLDGIEFVRMTPEGWRMALARMERVDQVELTGEEEEVLVKYLSAEYGLAPQEVKDYRYALERRTNLYEDIPDAKVNAACRACHTYARIALQRRTPEMWQRLPDSLLGLFPFTGLQVRGVGGDWYQVAKEGVPYLTKTFPFESKAWKEWKGKKKPDLAGKWAVVGYDPGKGEYTGEMTVEGKGGDQYRGDFVVEWADGATASGSTVAVVYTGFHWRGDTTLKDGKGLRDIFFVSEDGSQMQGRSLQTSYGELGAEETLYRVGTGARILAVMPRALKADGKTQQVKVFGMNLSQGLKPQDVSFGKGVEVKRILRSEPGTVIAEVVVAKDAQVGTRTVKAGEVSGKDMVEVYKGVDYIKIIPDNAMAALGGIRMPKVYQQFEAIAFINGPDGQKGTKDDVRIGQVSPVEWKMTEYFRTSTDGDLRYVGTLDPKGLFTPADDAPNLERHMSDSNTGDVWVWASYEEDGTKYGARAYLRVVPPRFVLPPIR